jgi:SAM-dependent methyltransferase
MAQAELNAGVWRLGSYVADYDNRVLEPAEVLLLARYREAFSGRVLDVGCGAGRLLGYIAELGADAHGVDISQTMVEACRRRFPGADVRVGELETLSATVEGPFDLILLSDNVLDVLDDGRRRAALTAMRALLPERGLLVFSSHNLAHIERPGKSIPATSAWRARAAQLANRSPVWMVNATVRLPRRRANRRRLAPLQYRAADHAIVNDEAHDYGLLHYYIARGDQERQLSELGYELVDVLELGGDRVPSGENGRGASLYYVATRH